MQQTHKLFNGAWTVPYSVYKVRDYPRIAHTHTPFKHTLHTSGYRTR